MTANQGTGAQPAKERSQHPTGHHGQQPRGLETTASSHLAQGKFGRLFRDLPPAFDPGDQHVEKLLRKLGEAMSARKEELKDGPDDEESGIPALYTYFGQFIDHDITFDPASSLQRQNDPDALVDYRTPAFDLDSLYGRGPSDQPYLYTKKKHVEAELFLLGDEIFGDKGVKAWDLPRNHAHPPRALIGDPRNDENVIVSQLQGLFLRFHNWMACENPDMEFDEIQQLVRFHYQYVILEDFLGKIVDESVLDQLKTDYGADSPAHKRQRYDREKLRFFEWINDPFMPVEFSVAAYRMGHSMVRPGYRLNDNHLLPIFPKLRGFQGMDKEFAIDWGRFINIGTERKYDGSEADKQRRLQFAYKIDTSLVDPLKHLGGTVSDHPKSLAERNLLRGWRLGLPSGQDVARAMAVEPLKDTDIKVRHPDAKKGKMMPISTLDTAFADNCPLWTYILAEAGQQAAAEPIPAVGYKELPETPKLGPVGGRIVAEVFLGLMFGDGNSMLRRDPLWTPEKRPKTWKPKGSEHYQLRDLVEEALRFEPDATERG